jgi:hypothetical protein
MRHYIGVSPQEPATLRHIRRDVTGEPLLLLDKDAIAKILINFSDYLESGETISSATATATGCTAAIATSTPNVTLTVSEATQEGSIIVLATTSTSQVWAQTIRVRRTQRIGDEYLSDYG